MFKELKRYFRLLRMVTPVDFRTLICLPVSILPLLSHCPSLYLTFHNLCLIIVLMSVEMSDVEHFFMCLVSVLLL